jgi:hypothetical protein
MPSGNMRKNMASKGWIEITYEELVEKVIADKPILVTTDSLTCYYKPLPEEGKTEVHVGGPILDTDPSVGNV